MKCGNGIFIKDGESLKVKLDDAFSYNSYDYNSRKVFMIRISSKDKSYFYLSPNMSLKSEVEDFFGESNRRKNGVDFCVKAFPLALCFVYFFNIHCFFCIKIWRVISGFEEWGLRSWVWAYADFAARVYVLIKIC